MCQTPLITTSNTKVESTKTTGVTDNNYEVDTWINCGIKLDFEINKIVLS